jgi:drug/metabolite transporter (DMT)-like permease
MRPMTFFLLLAQILLTVGGQMLWKKGIDQVYALGTPGVLTVRLAVQLASNLSFLIGTFLYGCATLLWFYLLSRFEFSYIYPFLSLTFIVSFVVAKLFLGEAIPQQRWIAVGLISLGVFLMTRS